MARPRKLAFNNSVLFVTMSVEEGLVFPPNPFINHLVASLLGRAQEQHPVKVCHFLVEPTHIHMLLKVDNPDDVRGFMERFKTESAHAINRLLGRKKRTIWCAGYDSPVVINPERVMEKIIYLYSNPVKDMLVQMLGEYPGLSSWEAFNGGLTKISGSRIYRSKIRRLARPKLQLREWLALKTHYVETAPYETALLLSPDAWMATFDIPKEEALRINQEIKECVARECEEHNTKRIKEGKPIIGAKRLVLEAINAPYVPNRTGRRMWCLSSDIPKRVAFIQFVKSLIAKAKEVLAKWRAGDYTAKYPLGLYPPSLPKNAELLTATAKCW